VTGEVAVSEKKPLNAADRMLIERAAESPIEFTYAPVTMRRNAKLVRSSISPKWKEPLHRLAVAGYLAESTTGCGGHGEPPETTIGFTITALGRGAIGLRAAPAVRARRIPGATDDRTAFMDDDNEGETI
jgi:hypothetical protein